MAYILTAKAKCDNCKGVTEQKFENRWLQSGDQAILRQCEKCKGSFFVAVGEY